MEAMSSREGRDKVIDLVIGTTRRLDVTGWWPKTGGSRPDECSLGGGEKGASYSYSYWAPMGVDRVGDAQKVAEYWKSLGMSVRIADSTPWPTVYGQGGPVLRASFDTGAVDNSYRVGAVARCAPGNASALLDEDNAQRLAGVVVPGDEGTVQKWDLRDRPPPRSSTAVTPEPQG